MRSRLSGALVSLHGISLELCLVAIVAFPLPVVLWQLLTSYGSALSPGAGVGYLAQGWDAGGQQPFSRALLRSLCAGLVVLALILPRRPEWSPPAWFRSGLIFLGLGALSAMLAPHRFQALKEWEIWVLAGLIVYVLGAYWRARWSKLCLGLSYFLAFLTLIQAFMVGFPTSEGRLGGLFYHPNALSTMSLMLLAVMLSRALNETSDAFLARCLSGGLLAIVIGTGSLTGGVLLVGTLGWLASRHCSKATRIPFALLAGSSLLLVNLLAQEWSFLFLPGLLLAMGLFVLREEPEPTRRQATLVIASSATLVLALYLFWTSDLGLSQAYLSRVSSGLGRLQFYEGSLSMLRAHPWFGVGPAGFSRNYPGGNIELDYFSKFPHSLPLELASEWGLPAACAFGLMLFGAACASGGSQETRTAGWVVLLFFLHSITDVQTQFPYLLVLAAIALGVVAAGEPQTPPFAAESRITTCTRALVALGCIGILFLNLARANAGFDRQLALSLARGNPTAEGRALVGELLASSFLADPLDSESARLWGLSLLSGGSVRAAQDIASLALDLDPNRASCWLLALSAEPPSAQKAVDVYRQALSFDRVNYPIFYRKLAEALWEQGRSDEAMALLRDQAMVYRSDRLNRLFWFREHDLLDQLVEFFALKAMLEEREGEGAGEADIRRAIQHAGGKSYRLKRLRLYLEESPFLSTVGQSQQLLWSRLLVEAGLPASVTGASNQPEDLEFGQATSNFYR